MTIRLHRLLPALLVVVAPIVTAEPQEGRDNDGPRRCINTGAVLRTKVINDANVLFIMRSDEMYLNTLRSRCNGLARYGRFAYTIQTRSLCELERITVIEEGSVVRPRGRSCTLGMFQPVTMKDLSMRFAPLSPQGTGDKIEAADIEEVVEQGAADDAEEDAEEPK